MNEKIEIFNKTKKQFTLAQILNIVAIIVLIICTKHTITNKAPVFIILGVIVQIFTIAFLSSTSAKLTKAEKHVMREIWGDSYTSEEAKERMLSAGCRESFVEKYIQLEERIIKSRTERKKEKDELAQAINKCNEILTAGEKPEICNKVRITGETNYFKNLKDYQYRTEWEAWRTEDKLYFYIPEMEGYPSFSEEAPYAFCIDVANIQYFKEEGSIKSELKITGGTIKQDKRTGEISQTPIKSQTVNRDERRIVLVLNVNKVVSKIEFSYSAYDALFAMIPEKDYNKVING